MMSGELIRAWDRKGDGYGFNREQKAVLRRESWVRRCQGWTVAQIAEDMGLSVTYVGRLLDEYMKANEDGLRDMHRRLELDRLDALERVALEAFLKDRDHPDWDAAKFALEVTKRRAAMLGLDEPVRAQTRVTVTDPMSEELEDVLREAAEAERRARAQQA